MVDFHLPESSKKIRNLISKSWRKNSLFLWSVKEESNTRGDKYNIDHGIFFMIEKINSVAIMYQSRTKRKKKLKFFQHFLGHCGSIMNIVAP